MPGRGTLFLHNVSKLLDGSTEPSTEKCGIGRGGLIPALLNPPQKISPTPIRPPKSECLIQFEDSSDSNSSLYTLQDKRTFIEQREQRKSLNDDLPALQKESIQPISKSVAREGEKGQSIEIITNFIRLNRRENHDIFLYEVEFKPPIENGKIIKQIIESEHLQKRLGTKPFLVGSRFYLPKRIDNFEMGHIPHPTEYGITLNMFVYFIQQVPLREQGLVYNFLFKKIMKTLNYSFMKNKYFNEDQKIDLEEWMLEIWPGYAVEVVQVGTNELMLMCDISNRVLHKTNVYDHLKLLMPNQRYKNVASRLLLGTSVITSYSKQTYRVDDIDFDSTPLSTFKYGNTLITYLEYFKKHWGQEIKVHDQPLLVHRKFMPKVNTVIF